MACVLECYLELYKTDPSESLKKRIDFYSKWLVENAIKNNGSFSWGTPFTWKSGETIYELGTGFNVVTAWTASAFFSKYECFKDAESESTLKAIYLFFTDVLERTEVAPDQVCFSYSPLKKDFIHNANLFASEFLIRYGKTFGVKEAVDLGMKGVNYSISQVLEDGSLAYYGKESPYHSAFNDSYHCSYEIRMLHSIWKLTDDPKISEAYRNYLNYFKNNFYSKGLIPLRKGESYPVDITSQAETMILFSQLAPDHDGLNSYLIETVQSTITHFQTPKGYFKYKQLNSKTTIGMPYIRWSQGWMALALAKSLSQVKP